MTEITKVIECETADDLLDALQLRGEYLWNRDSPHRWLFRGHADADWPLIASATRPGAFQKLFGPNDARGTPANNQVQITAEWEVISRFLSASDGIGLQIPDDSMMARHAMSRYLAAEYQDGRPESYWLPRSFFAIAALAQHSGLPTRLLDWTTSSFKAAYFAAAEIASGKVSVSNNHHKLAVWAIERGKFSPRMHTPEFGSQVGDMYHVPIELFAVPRAANPNARAQDGWFSIVRGPIDMHADVDRKPIDSILKSAVGNLRSPILLKFLMPAKQAARLLWLLAVEKIGGATVFPDFYGAAMAVREAAFYPHDNHSSRIASLM